MVHPTFDKTINKGNAVEWESDIGATECRDDAMASQLCSTDKVWACTRDMEDIIKQKSRRTGSMHCAKANITTTKSSGGEFIAEASNDKWFNRDSQSWL